MTAWAAKCTACCAEPHWRSMVTPGHRLRKAGCERRSARDVTCLGTGVVETAEYDVIDCGGVHVVSTDDGLDDMRGHVGWMFVGESAVSLADGGADCVDDEGFRHTENLTHNKNH